jgi:hypothetical protein
MPGAAKAFCIPSVLCGISFGNASANSSSLPTMTVKGAAKIFGRFFSNATAASFAFPCSLRTQTNRAGQQLAEVGAHLRRS